MFGFNVGWNNNFINIYNIIKTIFIFIWEQLTTLIYPLKLFNYLFFISIIEIFQLIMKELLVLLKEIPNILDNLVLLTSVGGFTSIASVAGLTRIISIMVNAVPVVTSAVKDVSSLIAEVTQRNLKNTVGILLNIINFIFNIIVVGNSLFKIVLKILDIILNVLKFFLFELKKVIIILSFFYHFSLISYIYEIFENDKKML